MNKKYTHNQYFLCLSKFGNKATPQPNSLFPVCIFILNQPSHHRLSQFLAPTHPFPSNSSIHPTSLLPQAVSRGSSSNPAYYLPRRSPNFQTRLLNQPDQRTITSFIVLFLSTHLYSNNVYYLHSCGVVLASQLK